jgi:hypothetical protein
MRTPAKLTAATAALTLGLASAALASGPSSTHGHSGSAPGHNRTQQTTPSTSTGSAPNSNAKAYGRLCQGESKKHVAGQKGTPFSKCVTDMAHLSQSSQNGGSSQTSTVSQGTINPARACANESKKHVAGQKGTPFSQCVSAAAKLLGQQSNQNSGSGQDSSGSDDSTTTSSNGS